MTISLADRLRRLASRIPLLVGLAAVGGLAAACGSSGGGGDGGVAGSSVSGSLNSTPGSGSAGVSLAEQIQAFGSTVQPLLTTNCTTCHAGAGPGTPHIAHPDMTTGFNAVVDNQKVNFSDPGASRLVRRLVADLHYCWSDCITDGATMQAAIEAWASLIQFGSGGTQVNGITSNSLTLDDGTEDSGNLRYMENAIAYYTFKEGEGSTVVRDVSNVAPAMDLMIDAPVDGVTWMTNWGLNIMDGRAAATPTTSRKLYDHIADPTNGTQQFTVEAWVIPDNVDQTGPARIVTYSNGPQLRNFMLGQNNYNIVYRNRNLSNAIDDNGSPALETPDAEEDLQATLQHIVLTYDQYRGRRIYVDGVFTGDSDLAEEVGRLWNWDPNYQFVIGDETNVDRQWMGRIQLLAVYKYALTDAQIAQNYTAGVGKKLVLRFDISSYASAGSYLEFRVEQLDEFSYLFCDPKVVTSTPGLRVQNLQIAVNGTIPVSGQAFQTLDATVTSSGQTISSTCSIIQMVDLDTDVFTLDFETLGDYTDPDPDNSPTGPTPVLVGEIQVFPNEGVRDFARVNDTMSALTGVDATTPAIANTFEELTQALPVSFDLRSFAAAHQVSIAKLSLEYCELAVETPAIRDALFPNFQFDQAPATAFDANGRNIIVTSLVNGMIGTNVANQPTMAEVSPIINTLIDDLTAICQTEVCDAERTETVVKAACSAVLSSAAVSVH